MNEMKSINYLLVFKTAVIIACVCLALFDLVFFVLSKSMPPSFNALMQISLFDLFLFPMVFFGFPFVIWYIANLEKNWPLLVILVIFLWSLPHYVWLYS